MVSDLVGSTVSEGRATVWFVVVCDMVVKNDRLAANDRLYICCFCATSSS